MSVFALCSRLQRCFGIDFIHLTRVKGDQGVCVVIPSCFRHWVKEALSSSSIRSSSLLSFSNRASDRRLRSLRVGRMFFAPTRDSFEPEDCGLGSGRVLVLRARVGSGFPVRAAGRVGPVHKSTICELLRAFSIFFK